MARADQIYVMRPFLGREGVYEHHGIDCGDGTVIHYRKVGEATISRTSIESFAAGNPIFVKHQPASYISDIVMQRAESRLGEQQYNLVSNNCEHFANWCKTGLNESQQLNNFGLGIGGIGAATSRGLIEEAATESDPVQSIHLLDHALQNIAIAKAQLQPQYERTQADVDTWHRVAQLALKQGRKERIVRAALERKVAAKRRAADFKAQIDQLSAMQADLLRNQLVLQQRMVMPSR
ncbi:MAG: hypothetical protein HC840_18490 [Leptolyngbyaceae cyanobacterium RM2_2_4]|nr:hypothetical protein [Leptolyngbyaceae cyanobacterium SM1_4_3]NJN91554.1 hypothetical protein [Leptolyngbyaceae cyanobacterium SL_5_14]NJO51099.1 hypothetical protein [Leptolyngbyaceae cyanobacterium RM2_2_4]